VLIERLRVHVDRHIECSGIAVKPGLWPLIELLAAHGVPKAVATSTGKARAIRKLSLAGILPHFDHIVAGDEIANGKPAPDIFLKAAEKLSVDAADCYVLEDSEAGVRAAHSAGMTPILVPDLQQPSDEVRALARRTFVSLHEATVYFETILKGMS
jgi:HAD superfamily hydrolase (TIGR01509 family)